MQIIPYIFFDGTCREAFTAYETIFRGKILMMMTAAGTPMADHVPPEAQDRIMHARLEVAGTHLMGSDGMMGKPETMSGFRVNVTLPDPEEAERIFAALAEGGSVDMPLQQTFWAKRFGMVKDRFGTPWMINCE